jgi:hypothetical protein
MTIVTALKFDHHLFSQAFGAPKWFPRFGQSMKWNLNFLAPKYWLELEELNYLYLFCLFFFQKDLYSCREKKNWRSSNLDVKLFLSPNAYLENGKEEAVLHRKYLRNPSETLLWSMNNLQPAVVVGYNPGKELLGFCSHFPPPVVWCLALRPGDSGHEDKATKKYGQHLWAESGGDTHGH